MNIGVVYALGAFVLWGLYPLYFRQLGSVSPLEVVLQRSVWCLVFLAVLLTLLRRWRWLGEVLRQPRQLALFALSALMISSNWLIYVYAVHSGQVVEASLGYFINPLFNVLLGVLVLRERLSAPQWVAVGFAAAGVLWLTIMGGRLPWIALALAALFSLYGLVRKTAPLGAAEGLTLETLLLAPLALPWLMWWTVAQDGALARGDAQLTTWLLLLGPLTALPLLLFAAAARRLPLATVGILQYLSPTIQLLLGVWVFGEGFSATRLVGFALIWAALAIYSADALHQEIGRRRQLAAA